MNYMNQKIIIIKVKIDNYKDFELKEYDRIYIDHLKMKYYLINPRLNHRYTGGIVLDIIEEDNILYAKVLISEEILSIFSMYNMEFKLLRKKKTDGFVFLYSDSNVCKKSPIENMELEYYKKLALNNIDSIEEINYEDIERKYNGKQ